LGVLVQLFDDIADGQMNTVFLATLKRYHSLNDSLRHPGRFEKCIELSVPDIKGRSEILTKQINFPHNLSQEDIDGLSRKSHGYSGSDLNLLCREAKRSAILRMEESGT
jgi:SpoVK/Ycf46/Vps4 family AAA+-type ATPase